VYDVLNMKIIQVDDQMADIDDLVYNVKGSLSPSRTLAYDERNNILFVNYDDFKIMYFKLNESNEFQYSYMDVVEVYGVERITDFSVMSENRLVVLTRDGQLVLFEYYPERMPLQSKALYSYRITSLKKSEAEFEKFISMTVDHLGQYIIVCSNMSSEAITKDLIWL